MLEHVGLGVDLVERHPEQVDDHAGCEPVLPDHRFGELPTFVCEVDVACFAETDQVFPLHSPEHSGDCGQRGPEVFTRWHSS